MDFSQSVSLALVVDLLQFLENHIFFSFFSAKSKRFQFTFPNMSPLLLLESVVINRFWLSSIGINDNEKTSCRSKNPLNGDLSSQAPETNWLDKLVK